MKTYFDYLNSIFNITIRIYQDGQLQKIIGSYYTPDTVTPYLASIIESKSFVAQIITQSLHCYGIVRTPEGISYIIGPAVRMKPDDVELKNLALELGISMNELPSLRSYLNSLPILTLTKFVDILCMVNSALGGEYIQPENILLGEIPQSDYDEDTLLSEDWSAVNYITENKLLSLIRQGDTFTLKKYIMSTQFRQDFNIANDAIRNVRNILIVSTTIVSRAAIEGGLPPAKAYDLSDMYIRTVETMKQPKDIYALMARMVLDFADRVGTCITPVNASPVIASCLRFIRRNISQPISLVDVARHAKMSPGYLSSVFKKEVGIPVSDYISSQRIEEAKHLLTTTNRTLADISAYLCFSSQSYFQNVFKKFTGMTPTQFKNQL